MNNNIGFLDAGRITQLIWHWLIFQLYKLNSHNIYRNTATAVNIGLMIRCDFKKIALWLIVRYRIKRSRHTVQHTIIGMDTWFRLYAVLPIV